MRIVVVLAVLALLLCAAAWGAFDNPNYRYYQALNNPANVKATEAQWSPDGTKVMWAESTYDPTAKSNVNFAIKIGDWDAAARTIVNIRTIESQAVADGWVGNPKWSPDGAYVGYLKWLTSWGPSQLWLYSMADGTTKCAYAPLTGTDIANFDFFGRNNKIVFWDWLNSQADFFGADLGTGNRWRMTNTPTHKEYEPRVRGWDSNEILFWSGETADEPYDSIHILNTVNGTISDVAAGWGDNNLYWPVWGRDNSYIGVVDWTPSTSSTDIYLYHKTETSWSQVEDLTGPGYSSGFWTFFGDFNKFNGFLFQSDIDGTGRDIWYAERVNTLLVTVPETQRYVKPGTTLQLTVDQSDLTIPGAGFQAFLSWQPGILQLTSAGYPVGSPYNMALINPMEPTDPNYVDPATGNVNLAAGSTTAKSDSASIASLTFTARTEGQAQVTFRSNNPPTMITDNQGNEIPTTTMDSATIVVDGTAPTNVTIAADPQSWTPANSVTLTFSAIDPFSNNVASGIDRYELKVDNGTYFEATSPYVLDVTELTDGEHTVIVKAIDQAGNEATASTTIYLDKTAPVITASDATVTAAKYTITATVDASVSGLQSFTLDGTPFSGTREVALVPGANPFTFTAVDNAGNSASRTVTITYNQPAPTITMYRSTAPNSYATNSSYPTWWSNVQTALLTGVTAYGDGYSRFEDVSNADQDYANILVTSFQTWKGLVTTDQEWGTRFGAIVDVNNRVAGNPGAAKLSLDNLSLGEEVVMDRADTVASDIWTYTKSGASIPDFGSTDRRAPKGYDLIDGTWVEVTSGRVADRIIFTVQMGISPDSDTGLSGQDLVNYTYKQMTGAVPNTNFTTEAVRSTMKKISFLGTYSGQSNVGEASAAGVNNFITSDATPPVVTISSPNDGLKTNNTTQTIVGTVTDNETLASGVREAEITLNGTQVYFNNTSDNVSFSQDVTLVEGNNTIVVNGKDFKGNTASGTISVLLDTVKPIIGINDDFGTGNVVKGTYTVTVTASDDSSGLNGIPVMNWDGLTVLNTTEVSPGVWQYTVEVNALTANGSHTITANITDQAGNSADQAIRTITVNKAAATISLQLVGVSLTPTEQDPNPTVNRTIKIVIGGTSGAVAPLVFTPTVTFDKDGYGSVTFTDLSNDAVWTKISAKDEQHTLRKCVDLVDLGNLQYSATIQLTGGDATNDNLIDILDFGVFAGQYNTTPDPNTLYPVRSANFDCQGVVYTTDFNFIQVGFLDTGDPEPLGASPAPVIGGRNSKMNGKINTATATLVPRTSVTVKELAAVIGMKDARKADVNNDGIVDTRDVTLFLTTTRMVK